MAMLSYRNQARDKGGWLRPLEMEDEPFNIVVGETVHAAFDKACMYFNIRIKKARIITNTDKDSYQTEGELDLKHVEQLIDGQTICLVGSAPNFPNGTID